TLFPYPPLFRSLLPKIHRSLAGHEREPRRGHGRWAMAVCRSRPVVRGHARRRRAGTTGRRGNHGGMTTTVPVTVDVEGPAGAGRVFGDLVVPQAAHGLVLFAHGSGSSRHSPRNRAVAARLHDGGLATLLLDLLTETEE